MKTILALRMAKYDSWAKKSQALSFAAEKRGWRIQVIDQPATAAEIRRLIDYWNPTGIAVVETPPSPRSLTKETFKGVPTVFLDCDPASVPPDIVNIRHDAHAIVALAVREFLSIGCSNIAYVGWYEPVHWSDDKLTALREILALHGLPLHEFNPPKTRQFSRFGTQLGKWLSTLPDGCGVIAVNDSIAEQVLNAAKKLGMEIPRHLAVIGVGQDEAIVERMQPTLSSFMLDYFAHGEAALQALEHPCAKNLPCLIRPFKLVHRQSSRRFFHPKAKDVEAAVELIRIRACTGLKAKDVLATFHCSRRFAERHFREVTGHSILEEIITVKLDRVVELLRNPHLTLGSLADQCGFDSPIVMRRQFKARFGKTMGEYRQEIFLANRLLAQSSRDPSRSGTR